MRTLAVVVLAIILVPEAVAAPPSFQVAVVGDAPALYYRFNETVGPVGNLGGLGAGFDGTSFGTPQRGVATAGGDAGIAFDTSDDYVESLGAAPIAFTGNPTFTAEAIVRIPNGATAVVWPPFLHWGTAPAQTGHSAWFGLQNANNNRVFVGFYNSGLRTANPVATGAWHHLVWVRNGAPNHSQQGSTLYVDGVAVSMVPDTDLLGSLVPDVYSTSFLVNRGHDLTRYFQGTLDELALYDHALTPVAVAAHYVASGLYRATIPGLFNTGVGSDGAVLPGGSVDPHYSLIASADPTYPGPSAIVASLIPTGYWFANNTLSKWIAPTADENYPSLGTPHPAGVYTYRLTFDLSGFDPQSVALSGSWGVDNGGSIRLNGVVTGIPSPPYSPLQAFALTSGFVPGTNTLDFIVTNSAAGGANPTGLRVEGLTATAPVVGVLPDPTEAMLALSAPWPNPATGLARIAFSLPQPGRARVRIRDVAGRVVRTLADREFTAGRTDLAWDGATERGAQAPAGVYFVELSTVEGSASRRIAWLR